MRLAGKQLSTRAARPLRGSAQVSADETAELLVKSRHTVIAQRRSLQAKLEARNLAHAVALAYERGLFPPEPAIERMIGPAARNGADSYDDADAPSYHERSEHS